MGVKIKAGMALGGLLLSWMFGLNFLSGIASTVDSTGNVLVDIADGIGLVSKASALSVVYMGQTSKLWDIAVQGDPSHLGPMLG